ncbi:MAG: sodium:calcium antiporter [Gemmatimonadota bacterium]
MALDAVASPLVALALVAALGVLIGAAKFFTGAAEHVGIAFGLSPFTVGVFIVALGTSLPELVSSVLAVHRGTSEVVSGNVIGANTANLLFILGVVAAASRRGIRLGEQYIAIDLNFMVGSAMVLALVMFDGSVGRVEASLLFAGYIAYVGYLMTEGRSVGADAHFTSALESPPKAGVRSRDIIILLAAGVGIFLSADVTLDALMVIAARIGISPAIASLTILSLGTTLPELAVSVTAARAGRAEMAVGNILGSCIFNSFGVLGIAAMFGRVEVPVELVRLPLPAYIGSAILFYLLTQDRRVSRWEGVLFVLLYLLLLAELAGLA